MKQLQVKKGTITTYRWWRGDKKNIRPDHVDALKESAEERIAQMTNDGYTSGELFGVVSIQGDKKKTDAAIEYTGWWEVREL
jgi:hypothetical protein